MMLKKMASGYDTSGLLFSDEVGNILTCAGNSVATIKSMRCLVLPQSVLRITALIESKSDLNSERLKIEKSCYANIM